MPFPDNCLKGIPNRNFLQADGSPASQLFHFKAAQTREDGCLEGSINWQDDDAALTHTLSQQKPDGTLQFQGGVAVLPRAHIDWLARLRFVAGNLKYERCALPGNRYHGNLLLAGGVSNHTMKQIAASIALHVSAVIAQAQQPPA
jgi:hypothetical protein